LICTTYDFAKFTSVKEVNIASQCFVFACSTVSRITKKLTNFDAIFGGVGCVAGNKWLDFDDDRIRITMWIQEFFDGIFTTAM